MQQSCYCRILTNKNLKTKYLNLCTLNMHACPSTRSINLTLTKNPVVTACRINSVCQEQYAVRQQSTTIRRCNKKRQPNQAGYHTTRTVHKETGAENGELVLQNRHEQPFPVWGSDYHSICESRTGSNY